MASRGAAEEEDFREGQTLFGPSQRDIMDPAPAHITISRTIPGDIGMREVRLWLDDELIGVLLHQQSVEREVAPGPHTLRAHNTFVGKRIAFELAPGEQARFLTANRTGCASSLIFLLGAGPIYLSLEREGGGQPPA
jgi:hypothetical protein